MTAEKDKPETWCKCEDPNEPGSSKQWDPTCPVHTPAVREKRRLVIVDTSRSLGDADSAEACELAAQLLDDSDRVSFTCDACGGADNCEYAFDLYNTNGDCLAEK